MQDTDWDDFRFFLSVAAAGSISGAASALQVNHSTVLRRLAHLEQSMGVRLFDRLPTGYALTPTGEALVERLAGVREQIDAAQRQLMGVDLAIRGTIRITAPDTLVDDVLMPHLARFHALHPGVQLQLAVSNAFMSLTRREADIAVRGSNQPPENLIGRQVGWAQSALYAARAYPGVRPSGTDLAACSWVAFDDSLSHLAQAKWTERNAPQERVAMRVGSFSTMVSAVEAGLGIGILPCWLADRRPGLVRLEGPFPEMDTQIWILTHPDLKNVARIRAFNEFLCEQLRASGAFRQ